MADPAPVPVSLATAASTRFAPPDCLLDRFNWGEASPVRATPSVSIIDASSSTCLRKGIDAAFKFYFERRSPICSLFVWRRPMAIVRRVSAIIISALDRMLARWPSAHVGEEVVEVVPALANRNASAAVLVISGVFLVIAPLLHRGPHTVFEGKRTANGMAMRSPYFSPEAATALARPCCESASSNDRSVSTVAPALVENGPTSITTPMKSNDKKPTVPFASFVLKYRSHERDIAYLIKEDQRG